MKPEGLSTLSGWFLCLLGESGWIKRGPPLQQDFGVHWKSQLRSHRDADLEDSMTPQRFSKNDPIAETCHAVRLSLFLTAAAPKAISTEWTGNVEFRSRGNEQSS